MNAKPTPALLLAFCAAGLAALHAPVCAVTSSESAPKPAAKPQEELPGFLFKPPGIEKTTLYWRNGEQLHGEPAGADAAALFWKTPLFTTPVPVKREALRRMEFAGDFRRPEGSFRIVLTDGSQLHGELDAVDDAALTFSIAGSGAVVIKREQIVCVERVRGPGLIAGGPHAILPAKADDDKSGSSASPMLVAAGGRAATLAFNLVNQRTLELPARSLIDFTIRSGAAPDFRFTASRERDRVAVETWGDELVLVMGKRFASAGPRIAEDDRAVQVRLAWDQAAGFAALYGPDGALWAELKPENTPQDEAAKRNTAGSWLRRLFGREEEQASDPFASRQPPPAKGVQLVNKGTGLMVERFFVSEWNGNPPPPVLTGKAAIETTTESIEGEPAGRNGAALVIRKADGSTAEVPLDAVRVLSWPRKIRMERDKTAAALWQNDGSLLTGTLKEVKDSAVVLETTFTAAPLTIPFKQLHAVILPGEDRVSGSEELAKLDVISDGKISLHGKISINGGPLPHFQPAGSDAALLPAPIKELTLTRALDEKAKFDRAPVLIHTKTAETLPVQLTGVDDKSITFTAGGAAGTTIAAASVHAIQFSAPASNKNGFEAEGWQLTGSSKGTSRSGNSIVLKPGSGIGHPWLLQGGDISFRMGRYSGLSTVRIRLFCQGTDTDSNSLNFIVGDFGSDVYCGVETGEGQLDSQTEVPTDRAGNLIRITFTGDQAELYVNGVKGASASIKERTGKKSGSGLILETASLWGNQVGSVRLQDFKMQTSPTVASPPPFTAEARREALLLPRLRRDDPPKHILIGRNGDMLRGVIESMTATHLAFRAGLENFQVPIDRVAAAVWTQKPDRKPEEKSGDSKPAAPAKESSTQITAELTPAAKDAQWLELTNGGRLALEVENWADDKVTGRHPVLGQCSIPAGLIYRVSIAPIPASGALAALANWKFENTPDPLIPGDEGGSSPESGKDAADFSLTLLDDSKFSLAGAKGKVVVLDFWATWCGPCVKSLPGLVEAMSAFPPDKVVFLAVNQGETKEQVQQFLETRGLKMTVALDGDQAVAGKYGVDGIPHTVVVDPAGKIAFVKTGFEPGGDKQIADAVTKALGAAAGGTALEKPAEESPGDSLLPPPKLQ